MKGNTREKVLSAAKENFSNNGYTRSTTKEIAEDAGLAEVTLFRHFETKLNLFRETIYEYMITPMLDSKVLDTKLGPRLAILNLAQERIDTLRNNRGLFMCALYESQFNDEIKDMLQEIYSKVLEVLKLYLEFDQEKMNHVKTEHMTQLFLSTMLGLIIFENLGVGSEFADSEDLIKTIEILIFQ